MFLQWLHSTSEWRHWGWNALTISFLATVAINVLHGWSVCQQAITIRRLRSGVSVSVPFFAFMSCTFFVFFCYGVIIDSLAAALNGALGCFYLAVVVQLWRVRRFTAFEKLLICTIPIAVASMLFAPYRELQLLVVLGAGLLPMLHQAWTIRRNRSIGAVDPRFLLVFLASSFFWTVYAFAIGDIVLEIINPIGLAIQSLIVALWLACRSYARR